MTKDAKGKLQILVNYSYKRISYTITIFLKPKLIKHPTTENEIKEIVDKLLETHGFPQCVGTKEGNYIEGAEPNNHYLDYINIKGYFPLKVQAACNCKYCFQHPVIN